MIRTILFRITARFEELDRLTLVLGLNLVAIAFFFLIAFRYNYLHPDNMGRLMFSPPDTKSYLAVADWLFGKTGQVPFATSIRPFLYPLLLGGVRQITHNPYVFWALQAVLWLAAINLSALAVFRLTNRKALYSLAFCVMAANVSAIALTFYALAETTVIFLWSVWLFVFSLTDLRNSRPRDLFLLTFLLALLTITKPVFQIPFLIFVGFALFRYHDRRARVMRAMLLALLPVVIQILVNVNLNGVAGVSNISEYTLKLYLLPQVVATRSGLSLDDARESVKDYDTIRAARYLLEDPSSSALAYVKNVFQNMTAPSDYISYYLKPYLFTQITSVAYLIIQVVLLPVLIHLFLTRKTALVEIFGWLFLFSILGIFTSGISFDEGDRLVIGVLPIWIVLYSSLPIMFLEQNEPQASVRRHAV